MAKDQSKLSQINEKLNEEINKVTKMQKELGSWAKNERKIINQQRTEKLRTGKISLTELDDLIDLIEQYETLDESQKQFVDTTLSQLSQLPN